MKKIYLLLLCTLLALSVVSQEEKDSIIEGWTKVGKLTLLINQSAFNENWTAGGESSFSGNMSLNYDFNYTKGDIIWDNKLIAAYGVTQITGNEGPTKTDDRLDFHSSFGKKTKKEFWYYSAFVGIKTQFDAGYIDDVRTSQFLSPLDIQAGLGMMWKKSDNLKVMISPLTSKFIFVDGKFTVDGPSFGVEQGETMRYEFGTNVSAYYKFELGQNVAMENILMLYSNYLEDPQNVDIDYTMNLVMTINKLMTANLEFQAIYDDNAIEGFQIREVFGLGFNVHF